MQKNTLLNLLECYYIQIPIIQRDYAQGRKGESNIRHKFISDLYDTLQKGKYINLDFIYGSVNGDKLYLLDGQQRITTLFLLHWYVAMGEKISPEKYKNTLSKFSYETRSSSREFCHALITKEFSFQDETKKLSEQIINCSWFFMAWKKDPTVQSMLTMLDTIQDIFKITHDCWDKLNNITFQFLKLEDFGLSDDLYLKMNSRGRPLTEFENFKANLIQKIKDINESKKEKEPLNMNFDGEWTDLFWNLSNQEKLLSFDERYLNFLRAMAIPQYTEKNIELDNEDVIKNISLLSNANNKRKQYNENFSFKKYDELNCFDYSYFKNIKRVLDNKDNDQKEDIVLDYFNGMLFKQMTNNSSIGFADLIGIYAYFYNDTMNNPVLVRVIRNLVEAYRPYQEARTYFNSIKDMKKLHKSLAGKDEIESLDILSKWDFDKNKINVGYLEKQLKEEKIKAELMKTSNDWKEKILAIENHCYLKGKIQFLLDWSKEEGHYNLDKFKRYSEIFNVLFNEKEGKNKFAGNSNAFLFERSLLTFGDYLLKTSNYYSFLIDKDRDISWKSLLEKEPEHQSKKILKMLIDDLLKDNDLFDEYSIKEKLISKCNDFISEKNNEKDWRYNFIKYPSVFKHINKEKHLIHYIRDKGDRNIYIMSASTLSGYVANYYLLPFKDAIDKKKFELFDSYKYPDINVIFNEKTPNVIYTKNWVKGISKYKSTCIIIRNDDVYYVITTNINPQKEKYNLSKLRKDEIVSMLKDDSENFEGLFKKAESLLSVSSLKKLIASLKEEYQIDIEEKGSNCPCN